jgi:hypothetical protein
MKTKLEQFIVFSSVFLIYFAVATEFTFQPKWALDYYNLLAKSLTNLRLDIPNPPTTRDLAFYNDKWYAPWGILPAILLIPVQFIKKGFIPTIYLSVFFASLNVSIFYLLLKRVRKEFLPKSSKNIIFAALILYALGTTHFYVGTLGSVWHVQQVVTTFFSTLGIYFIFKKKRSFKDYFLSITFMSVGFLGRPTIVFLLSLPILLFIHDRRKTLSVFAPILFFMSIFFTYNYLRFDHPLNYGHKYINEEEYLKERRAKFGTPSIMNIPYNMRYMLLEMPRPVLDKGVKFNFNLKGNSIFFLTPPLLAIFLAKPRNIYISSLWATTIITMLPSLTHYSSGWIQFGYRYSLDVTALLVILSVFGIKGKLNSLYVLGIVFAVWIHWLGINALM